ncbi:DNA methyltransferase [Methyloraptor flagellatus]|uniref:Methyltransferase n=1 Tax=Methyloraptor flagellatus TaxID=3162530 RepID=A0AAU7XFV5_9HYPH
MGRLPSASVDLVLTDPPYLVRYRDRAGRTIRNDASGDWLRPAFAEMYRLLKPDTFCVSFYGWNAVDLFGAAWREAGFRMVGHLVFQKPYASSARFLAHHHEQAFLLAKGRPAVPAAPIADVQPWTYTGNRLHPTQKPVRILKPLVRAFSPANGLVLDPFCGSGSSLVAAVAEGRAFLGIELDPDHYRTARDRLGCG